MNKGNIFVFLLCIFIVIGGFSTQYYLNNKGYHDWVNKYFLNNYSFTIEEKNKTGIPSPQDILDSLSLNYERNETRVREIIEADRNNLKYQGLLKTLIGISLFIIIFSIAFILSNISLFPNRRIFKEKEM